MAEPLRPELVILVGLPGAGKSTFHRERFAATHVLASKDLLRNRRDRAARERELVDAALAAGQSVVVDDVNAMPAPRRALIDVARARGATVVAYVLETPIAECVRRNRARSGRARVPDVAIFAAAKHRRGPSFDEGIDAIHRVDAREGTFVVVPVHQPTVFLLSPASTSGERAALLFNDRATFPLALRLRSDAGAPLGEVFTFLSGLYFRGKLAYAHRFARPPAGLCGAFVITPGEGLRDPTERETIERLRAQARVPVRPADSRYLGPLLRDAEALARIAGPGSRIVLLGSIASTRYVEPLLGVFGERLRFPTAFVGRGDMSRGGLLLRCVDDDRELDYEPLAGAVRHGPRPARLAPRVRRASS